MRADDRAVLWGAALLFLHGVLAGCVWRRSRKHQKTWSFPARILFWGSAVTALFVVSAAVDTANRGVWEVIGLLTAINSYGLGLWIRVVELMEVTRCDHKLPNS